MDNDAYIRDMDARTRSEYEMNVIEELERSLREFAITKKQKRTLEGCFYFITLNFKEGFDVNTMLTKCSQVIKKLKGEGYYSIEQRSNDINHIHGIHCHLIVSTKECKSKVKQHTYECVRKMVGCNKHVDVRKYDNTYLNDKIDYISGKKWDSDKEDKVEIDKLWRQNNNIKDIYTVFNG